MQRNLASQPRTRKAKEIVWGGFIRSVARVLSKIVGNNVEILGFDQVYWIKKRSLKNPL